MFAKIIRFDHAKQCMVNFPQKDLLSIAEECGYYDYTHFANDFKAMTGDSPSVFRQEKVSFYSEWGESLCTYINQ
jgi:transcriptional regulator GlxA family with amidase domain